MRPKSLMCIHMHAVHWGPGLFIPAKMMEVMRARPTLSQRAPSLPIYHRERSLTYRGHAVLLRKPLVPGKRWREGWNVWEGFERQREIHEDHDTKPNDD